MLKNYPRKDLFWLDKVVVLAVFGLLGLLKPDTVLMFVFLFAFCYLIMTKRTGMFYFLYVSGIICFFWMIVAAKYYGYNQDFMQVYGVTLFPFFAGSLGLFGVYLVYYHYEAILKLKGYFKQLGLFTGIYWILLLAAEKIGYEVFNIKNMAAIDYDPLAICGCLHAAPWMQVAYLLAGPLFFSICYWLKIDRKVLGKPL